jgi:THO complex subunit 2
MSVITTSVVASLPLLLPTPEDICEAVRQNKEDECQKLILSCLRYGTSSSSSSPPGDTTQRWKDACNVLEEAWTDVVGSQTSTLFLDVMVDSIWLMVSVSPPSPSSDHSTPWQGETSLVHILQTMLRVAFDIGPQTHSLFAGKLQANLFPAFLDAIGLSSTLPGEDLVKRLRMHNTQVNYKQQKYNLLQEESEGYAKLLHFLSETQTERNRTPLLHIIGTFRLDPNRVLDLALDVLDAKLHQQQQQHPGDRTIGSPQVRRVLDIIRALPHDKLPSLIAFKLSHGETEADGQRRLQTVAFLISHEVLAWRSLMEFFPPIEHDIEEAYNIHWIKEKNRILALTRVSLSGSAGSQEDPKQAEYRERLQAAMKPLEKNSLVNIAFLLICAGKWAEVRPLLSRDLWSRLACLMPRRFGNALCDEALRRTEESYRARVGGPGLNQPWHAHDGSLSSTDTSDMTVDIDSIVSSLWDPLSCIVQSGCIASRPVLFCTICRLLAKLLQATEEGQRCEYSLSSDTFMFFRTFLVPSLSLFPSNPAVSTELWSVLTFLSYPTRYDLYQGWRGMGLERGGLGSSATGKPLPNVLSEMEAGKAARYVLKRLSKDNVRDMSRQLAKVTHANPLVVFATILSQIESYDNMVEVMVEAQRFVNPLGLDVLGYCILGRLSGSTGGVNRSRLKGMKNNGAFDGRNDHSEFFEYFPDPSLFVT